MSEFKGVLANCAPAALTAMLLKLEANYFENDAIWSGLLDIPTPYGSCRRPFFEFKESNSMSPSQSTIAVVTIYHQRIQFKCSRPRLY